MSNLLVVLLAVIGLVGILFFVKGAIDESKRAAQCRDNLAMITREKEGWFFYYRTKRGEYGPNISSDYSCPSDGVYIVGPLGEDPRCTIKGHQLPK